MHEVLEILIVTALHAEARPFINHFKLKKESTCARFETFRGEGISVVVTGVGKVKSAIATTALLCEKKTSTCVAVNVGIAGAHRSTRYKIGELRLIHKIKDMASGREYYPDLLVQTDLQEAALHTFDKLICETDRNAPLDGLVDMEGAGFFEASSAFLPPHLIGCLKIVSDKLSTKLLKIGDVSDLVARQMPSIEAFLQKMAAMGDMKTNLFGAAETAWITTMSASLRLTVSQERQLKNWVAQYLAYRHEPLPDLPPAFLEMPNSKRERSSKLELLRNRLVNER